MDKHAAAEGPQALLRQVRGQPEGINQSLRSNCYWWSLTFCFHAFMKVPCISSQSLVTISIDYPSAPSAKRKKVGLCVFRCLKKWIFKYAFSVLLKLTCRLKDWYYDEDEVGSNRWRSILDVRCRFLKQWNWTQLGCVLFASQFRCIASLRSFFHWKALWVRSMDLRCVCCGKWWTCRPTEWTAGWSDGNTSFTLVWSVTFGSAFLQHVPRNCVSGRSLHHNRVGMHPSS